MVNYYNINGEPSQTQLDKYAKKQGYHCARYVMKHNGMDIFLLDYADHIVRCEGYPQYFGLEDNRIVEFDVDTNMEIFNIDSGRVGGSGECEKEPYYHIEDAKALAIAPDKSFVRVFVQTDNMPYVVESKGKVAVKATKNAFGLKYKSDNAKWERFEQKNGEVIFVRKDCNTLINAAQDALSLASFGDTFNYLCYGLNESCNIPNRVDKKLLPEEDAKFFTDGSIRTLTRYIPIFDEIEIGECICNERKLGKWLMPRYEYFPIVKSFIKDLQYFVKKHHIEEAYDFEYVLKGYHVDLKQELPDRNVLSTLNEKALVAIILGVLDKELTYPGQLYAAFECGYIKMVLEALEKINQKNQKVFYAKMLREPIYEDDYQEVNFTDWPPVAVFIGSKEKRNGQMIMKVFNEADGLLSVNVYGDAHCKEYLNIVGLDLEVNGLSEGWKRIDFSDGDFLLLNSKPEIAFFNVPEIACAVVELVGECTFYKWYWKYKSLSKSLSMADIRTTSGYFEHDIWDYLNVDFFR